jgi:Protein of unknown function (DUF5131)
MATETAIAWTDHTFNPWIGCTRVSAECDNCYAWGLSRFRGWAKWGRGEPRHVTKTGRDPRKWNRQAEQSRVRHRVFCASLADVFDAEVADRDRDTLWDLIRDTPWLDWQLLTKRPNLIKRMLPTDLVGAPNIWLGTSLHELRNAPRASLMPDGVSPPRITHSIPASGRLGIGPRRGSIDRKCTTAWCTKPRTAGSPSRPARPGCARSETSAWEPALRSSSSSGAVRRPSPVAARSTAGRGTRCQTRTPSVCR